MAEFPSIAIIAIATDCFSSLFNDLSGFEHNMHRMKNVEIRSFFWSVLYRIRTRKNLNYFPAVIFSISINSFDFVNEF